MPQGAQTQAHEAVVSVSYIVTLVIQSTPTTDSELSSHKPYDITTLRLALSI